VNIARHTVRFAHDKASIPVVLKCKIEAIYFDCCAPRQRDLQPEQPLINGSADGAAVRLLASFKFSKSKLHFCSLVFVAHSWSDFSNDFWPPPGGGVILRSAVTASRKERSETSSGPTLW
jgi:hypothetical protein